MKTLKLFVILNVILAGTVFANDKDNGGDICEERILSIKSDLRHWILKNEYKQMNFTDDITQSKYRTQMLQAMNDAVVRCTTKIVLIGGTEKTCINNYDEKLKKPIIKCNFSRFQKTNESKQYRLVHHEFAGVAGLEMNASKEESNYFFSKQIVGFLKDTTIKKLVVNSYAYPKNNFLEVRAEFERRYECGIDEDAPMYYSCEHGLRKDRDLDHAKIILEVTEDNLDLSDIKKIALKDLEIIKEFSQCSDNQDYCVSYSFDQDNNICELFYHKSGEAIFSCLDDFNHNTYNSKLYYFLPVNTKEAGKILDLYKKGYHHGQEHKAYAPHERSILDIVSLLFAPLSELNGARTFPKSIKTDLLVKEVEQIFKTIGVKQIGQAQISSAYYIGLHAQATYAFGNSHFSLDYEYFTYGRRGLGESSIYILEAGNENLICWSHTGDDEDYDEIEDMNICINQTNGMVHFTYLIEGTIE